MAGTIDKWTSKGRLMRLFATLFSYLKKGGIRKLGNDLSTLRHFISDTTHRRYKDYSLFTILLSIATIGYVLFPLDFIPDILPMIGIVDDLTILTWALSCLGDELRRYKEWKESGESKKRVKEGTSVEKSQTT